MDPHQAEVHLDPIESFLSELRRAKAFHVDAPDGGRLAAIVALSAVLEFMWEQQTVRNERLHEPLANLRDGIIDFEQGKSPRIFERARGRGRPVEPTEQNALQAVSALAMEALMHSGKGHEDSARRVARMLRARGWKRQGRDPDITWITIKNWRDACVSGDPKKDAPADYYRALKPLLSSKALAKNPARSLIDWASKRYPHKEIS